MPRSSSSSSSSSESPQHMRIPKPLGGSRRGTESARRAAECRKRFIFLFVNPTSGGNAASAFTTAGLENAVFKDPDVDITICDIREGTSGNKPGFLQLKTLLESDRLSKDEEVCVIAAGGDGTVMWCASELWAHAIDDARCVIGVVPYGTGNDFARALEWNNHSAPQPFEQQMKSLRQLCELWVSCPVVYHDVWEIEVLLHSNGCFKQIDSKSRKKKVLMEGNEKDGRFLTRKTYKMNNYFSLGVESRIGIGFDRHRTTSQARNKMVYINEGLKKMFFKRTAPVDKLVANMTSSAVEGREDVIFTTESSSHTKLRPTMSLIALNIPSFASGMDIWKDCEGKPLGVSGSNDKELLSARQQMGDGKLEFLSFQSTFSLGCEQAFTGNGKRIHQGGGPFTINFKPLAEEVRVYYQVDGEFFQMLCPQKIIIRLFKQLKVLANADSDRQECYNPVEAGQSLGGLSSRSS